MGRVTTITHEKTSTTTQRPEQTYTVDRGVLRCISDNNDYKQGDQAHFGTLDHFNSVARSICEQEKVDFSSDGNGNYGMDYGQLDTPVKPILFSISGKQVGANVPPSLTFLLKIMMPQSKHVCRTSLRLSTHVSLLFGSNKTALTGY